MTMVKGYAYIYKEYSMIGVGFQMKTAGEEYLTSLTVNEFLERLLGEENDLQ